MIDQNLDIELIPRAIRSRIKTAPSLRPDEAMMNACLTGQPEAVAVREAWRFQTNKATIIRTVTREEFKQMIDRQGDFDGR